MKAQTVYFVSDLEACETDALPASDPDGIEWQITTTGAERSAQGISSGCPLVEVYGPSKAAVVEFVRKHWGDDDSEWFQTYIVDRVESGEV